VTANAAARPILSLDGPWAFTFTGAAARLDGERQIKVPGVWQAQFAELRNSAGTGTYRRTVELPAGWTGKRAVLVFEGVSTRPPSASMAR